MKLGSSQIRSIKIGSSGIFGGFLGAISLTQAPDKEVTIGSLLYLGETMNFNGITITYNPS